MSVVTRARRRAGSAVVDGFFRTAARLGGAMPAANPERHGVSVVRDLAYGHDAWWHRADLYRPETEVRPWDVRPDPVTGLRPVCVYLHGGGFRILDKDTHWIAGLAFARRGWLTLNLRYRLGADHPYPAALSDAALALAWLARELPALGGDPARVIFAGESAGANLALTLATVLAFDIDEPWAEPLYASGVYPRAVLPAQGIFQVTDTARLWRDRPMSPFVQDRLTEVEHAYVPPGHDAPLADPLLVLESDAPTARPFPPTWLAVGTRDPLLDDTRRLAAALVQRGVPHEVTYWPGEVHAFHMFAFLPKSRACWRDMLAFAAKSVNDPVP